MFSKLKQIKDLRDQAKKIQSVLGEEQIHVSHRGVDIMMNGNQEITALTFETDLLSPDKKDMIEKATREAVNEAVKKIQKIMAQKMQEMQKSGAVNFPGLE